MNNTRNNDGTIAIAPGDSIDAPKDPARRRFLTTAATVVGAAGVATAAIPFIESLEPSARALAGGAPVEIDVGKLKPGQMMSTTWRKKPVWVLHRTDQQLQGLSKLNSRLKDPQSKTPQQPSNLPHWDPVQRSIKPHYLLVVGICTHLGCIPEYLRKANAPMQVANWPGGFYCPCHGSHYDLSGRIMKGSPAPLNLPVIPHYYKSDKVIVAGSMSNGSEQNWKPATW